MEISGRIIHAFPAVTGTSQRGTTWTRREYVLETFDQYPRKVHFDFFNERVNQYPLNEGDYITLSFDIESREYNGRWYTSIRGWKAVPADPNAAPGVPAQFQQPMAPQQPYPQQPMAPQQPYAPQAPQQPYQQAAPQQSAQAPAPQPPMPDPMNAPAGDDLPF